MLSSSKIMMTSPKSTTRPGVGEPPNVRAFYYYVLNANGTSLNNVILVDWDEPDSDIPVLEYVVEMKEGPNPWGGDPNPLLPSGVESGVPSAIVTTTHAWEIYNRFVVQPDDRFVRVKANTGDGYGPWSLPVGIVDATGMSPLGLEWNKSSGSLNLSWEAPPDRKGYVLQDYVIVLTSSSGAQQSLTAPAISTGVSVPGSVDFAGIVTLRARYPNGLIVAGVPSGVNVT